MYNSFECLICLLLWTRAREILTSKKSIEFFFFIFLSKLVRPEEVNKSLVDLNGFCSCMYLSIERKAWWIFLAFMYAYSMTSAKYFWCFVYLLMSLLRFFSFLFLFSPLRINLWLNIFFYRHFYYRQFPFIFSRIARTSALDSSKSHIKSIYNCRNEEIITSLECAEWAFNV